MIEAAAVGSFNWRLPLFAVPGTLAVFAPVAIWTSEGIFYLVVVVPIISLFVLAYLRGRQRLSLLIVYWIVSAVLLANYSSIRESSRWLLWSNDYKVEVLPQNGPAGGELAHVEWDVWGFPGAGNTTVYLVFDPTDALSVAAKSHSPGKFAGLPCEVPLVRRLENNWYAVRFYTGESWGRGNTPGC